MKFFLALLISALFANSAAHAGLGETAVQLQTRYGPPLTERTPGMVPGSTWRTYRVSGMLVNVEFVDGTSECESYRPLEGGSFSQKGFTNAEVTSLLQVMLRS